MKKLLVVLMVLGVVGCSSKGTEPQLSEIPEVTLTPKLTEGTQENFTESKINIDLYKVDEYYPVVDGVVTYPDGTIEEFVNGQLFPIFDDNNKDELILILYELNYESNVFDYIKAKEDSFIDGMYHYTVNVGNHIITSVSNELPDEYEFVESSSSDGGIVDGVFGIELVMENARYPYVIYRYSNFVPKGEDINNAFRLSVGDQFYYIWRIKSYDELDMFEEVELSIGRYSALWWGGYDGDWFPPHKFTFE